MCGTVPEALVLHSPGKHYSSQKYHPPLSVLSAIFNEVITNYYGIFIFVSFTRLTLPATHNPTPAIYLCQLALMPTRCQVPLLVPRRQPVCTMWCHPRVCLLSWFQSLQQTTGRQWSERLQPKGFSSKFYLFPSTIGSWHQFPQEEILKKELPICNWHRFKKTPKLCCV